MCLRELVAEGLDILNALGTKVQVLVLAHSLFRHPSPPCLLGLLGKAFL